MSIIPDLPHLIGVAVALVIAGVSAFFYDHRGQRYGRGKGASLPSARTFAWVYRYLQLSTLIGAILAFIHPLPWLLIVHRSLTLYYCGMALAVGATALFVAAKLDLGEHYSPCFDAYAPCDVMRDGVYSYIRHPIYVANLLLTCGIVLASGSMFLLVNLIVLAVYYVRSAIREERQLTVLHPSYVQYMATTGRFLPRLWTRSTGR
jgi:protein-S-isoprenylcysteine O-methyltransferase Ste14